MHENAAAFHESKHQLYAEAYFNTELELFLQCKEI